MFFGILIFEPNWVFCRDYSLCMMAGFQNRLISRIFGVSSSGFLHRTTLIWLKNPFTFFFGILFLDENWLFFKAYGLCMIPDFQNRLISGIFRVFSGGFWHTTTLIWLKNRFSHVFFNFNFWTKLGILQRL